MAKIKLGAIVVAMSGKLGGHVFAKNTGGAYMRTKTTPTNPQTVFQTVVRSIFAAISSAWSALTDAQRTSFRDKVPEYARTDVFGDLKNPTGKALYQRLNQNLEISEQAQIQVAPNPTVIPSALITFSNYIIAATFSFTTTGDSTGSQILVFATPALSQGTAFVKNKLRQISVLPGGVDVNVDIRTAYEDRFGAGVVGDNIFIAAKYINVNGQASPLQTFKVLVTGI